MVTRYASLVRVPLVLALWLASAGIGMDARAHAQSASEDAAIAAFDAGRLAYAEADYERALIAFRASYDLSGKSELLYNIGMTLERLRRDPEAIEAFERYLAALPEAGNRVVVERRLAVLREAVAQREAASAPPTVPTPEVAARAHVEREPVQRAAATPAHTAEPAPQASTPLYAKWWFWTSIGAVVAAGVVTGVVVAGANEPASTPIDAIRL